jgi:filamentous hemagglutinin family protein
MKKINGFENNGFNTRLSCRLTLALLLCFNGLAHGTPSGGVVAAGTAGISNAGSKTIITQSTPKVIINWQGFNVGAGESVQFIQPSSSAIALNRVMSPSATNIVGNISANGRIFLLNPNGIVFSAGSQVNVGGMVASTLGLTDAQFLAGNYRFSGDSTAAISNHGHINTNIDGAYIALLGANVSNTGVITTRLGTVALAAGNGITLDVAGDRLLNVIVTQGAIDALASNGHLLVADGGQVLMTARGASNLLPHAVNNTGVIQAQSIDTNHGSIILSAGPQTGTVNLSGTANASGLALGQTGGSVQVLGGTVNLINADINVSGNAGGGQAIIGGNFHGAGLQANSSATNIDAASRVNADAINTGNGGTISVWSDNTTVMGGTLTARGGAHSGDGGFIETSGNHLILTDTAYVNTLATNGKTGMWLLDPINWTIATTGGDETPAQVTTSLASSDRTIDATNDITVSNAITWTTSQTLTLDAGNDININAAITGSTAGAKLNLVAGHDVLIANTGTLTTSGAGNQINITAGNNINAIAATFTSSDSVNNQVNLTAGNNVDVGTVTTTGSASFIAGNNGSGAGTVTIGTAVNAASTLIRFNPTSYTNTNFEVATYQSTIPSGTTDIKAWVFLQGNDKVYDQTAAATLSLRGAPPVTFTAGTASFINKNIGVNKVVSYSGYSLDGSPTNLALFSSTNTTGAGTTTATITPAPLVVSATGINKVYDTTTSASVNLSANPIAGDVVNPGYSSASFSTPYVGSNKPVSVVGIALSGVDANNYSSNSTASTTASITADPSPIPIPTPIPDPILSNPVVVPLTPLGPANQAPLAMQEELKNGVFSFTIVPIIASSPGLMAQTRNQAQSDLLTVIAPPPGLQMQSLIPVPVMAPYRAPKQGRN